MSVKGLSHPGHFEVKGYVQATGFVLAILKTFHLSSEKASLVLEVKN